MEWSSPRTVTSQPAVARFFGVADQTIVRWAAAGMPRDGSNYDLEEIARWRIKYLVQQLQTSSGAAANGVQAGTGKAEQERIQLLLKNEKLFLELRQKRGELVEIAQAEAEITQMLHEVRQRLEAIPGELAASIPPRQRAQFVADARHKIELACRQMEGWALRESDPAEDESTETDAC